MGTESVNVWVVWQLVSHAPGRHPNSRGDRTYKILQVTGPGVRLLVQNMTGRVKKCMICGLSDGHTLIDCPYRCHFCGESVNVCDCVNSSLVDGVLASETPDKMSKVSKRKADTDDRLVTNFFCSSDVQKVIYLRTLCFSYVSGKMLVSMTARVTNNFWIMFTVDLEMFNTRIIVPGISNRKLIPSLERVDLI